MSCMKNIGEKSCVLETNKRTDNNEIPRVDVIGCVNDSTRSEVVNTRDDNTYEYFGSSLEETNISDDIEKYDCLQIRANDKRIDNEDHNFFEELQSIAPRLMSLKESQRTAITDLIKKHKLLFVNKSSHPKHYEHKIRLTTDKPYIRKSYPVPMSLREQVGKEIQNMLETNIIERSESPYCNPITIVRKKDGSIRVCLDARHLNAIIENDCETPPPINELLQKHHGVKFMSTSDLACGYWQIPLAKESRRYTAFLYGSTLYQFKRIPFGLKTAGSGFIRALDLALGDTFSDFLTCYVDDLLITSRSFDEHLRHIDRVFTRLREYDFTLRLSKSLFCRESIPFLGFILTCDGVRPDPEKLKIIYNFEEPRNRRQLQQFLGVCNFYRLFSIKHSNLINPFRDLLGKNNPWKWTDDHATAFVTLKKNFAESIMLHHVIPGLQFKIQTDASDHGISGVMYQIDKENNHRIISLVSRCLTSAERNYTTTEKELLAIVYTITKCRIYLLGTSFEIITDHQSLKYMNNTVFKNARLTRWSLLLQQYSFTVRHCSGKDNVVADFFSRNPDGKFHEEISNRLVIASLSFDHLPWDSDSYLQSASLVLMNISTIDEELRQKLDDIAELQKRDAEIIKIYEDYKDVGISDKYYVYKDIVFYRDNGRSSWTILLPRCLTCDVVKLAHIKLGHAGVYKTLQYLRSFYYWRGMTRDVKRFVLTCDMCQRVKHLTIKMEGEYQMVRAHHPNDLVTVDFYGPLPRSRGGVQYLFVAIDAFSKYTKLYPIKRATAQISIRKILEDYVPKIGKPLRILSDNGTQFTSAHWKNKLEKENIQVLYSSVRHPQSNPTERVMRELGRLFRTLCSHNHTKWAKTVPEIENLLNVTTHFSTGFSPYELHFGKKPHDRIKEIIKFPPESDVSHDLKIMIAKEHLLKSFQTRKKQQKSSSNIDLNVDDLVLLKTPIPSNAIDRVTKKFFHLYQGPFKIVKRIGVNAYMLSDPDDETKTKGVYNRANLRKYYIK